MTLSLMSYADVCRATCGLCRNNTPIDIARLRRNEDGIDEKTRCYLKTPAPEPPQHILGYTDYTTFNVPNRWQACTAPTREEYEAALRARIEQT